MWPAARVPLPGFGTGLRLEYLLLPLTFSVGAPLVAFVGANIGANQMTRALRIAFVGAGLGYAERLLGLHRLSAYPRRAVGPAHIVAKCSRACYGNWRDHQQS